MKFFDNVFNYVDNFFDSLRNYNFSFGTVFFFAVALFLFAIFIVLLTTSNSYEAKLIKAIDMFNNHFMTETQITEDNLIAFNDKMKLKKVPKQLRKQWQQFMLYREGKASEYMSFENCVANPIRNSSYKKDIKTLNVVAYILATMTALFNAYLSYDNLLSSVVQKIFLTPALILLLNYIVTIFLELRYNAIVADLYQNYQYFEVNIDKATTTLPEYVDYEVLFDRNEIKKGIPILYAYLQRRSEEEKRELERARLKNVEHEKFNFDDAGVAGSLVLERAMQEAENYIAERKKYNQDTEQINNDMSQEDMAYRETTKEYNRQMQVSRETFANFKEQLENVSSSIEANYLKKQQQQELDRQRNLERDFDIATEKHKKILESFQEELDTVDKFRAESRKTLEDAMKSEFETYARKIYDSVKEEVKKQQKEKENALKAKIKELEEKLSYKSDELEDVYNKNQELTDQLTDSGIIVDNQEPVQQEAYQEPEEDHPYVEPEQEDHPYVENEEQEDDHPYVEPNEEPEDEGKLQDFSSDEDDDDLDDLTDAEEDEKVEKPNSNQEEVEDDEDDDFDLDDLDDLEDFDDFDDDEDDKNLDVVDKNISTAKSESNVKPGVANNAKRRGRPRKEAEVKKPAGKRGRPRKEAVKEEKQHTGKRGRPRKEETTKVVATKKRGRPAKAQAVETVKPAGKRGRPAKVEKPKRGRPAKVQTAVVANSSTGKRGRPRKEQNLDVGNKPRALNKANELDNIDAYIKKIDEEIAKENARLAQTRKELVKKSRIRGNR